MQAIKTPVKNLPGKHEPFDALIRAVKCVHEHDQSLALPRFKSIASVSAMLAALSLIYWSLPHTGIIILSPQPGLRSFTKFAWNVTPEHSLLMTWLGHLNLESVYCMCAGECLSTFQCKSFPLFLNGENLVMESNSMKFQVKCGWISKKHIDHNIVKLAEHIFFLPWPNLKEAMSWRQCNVTDTGDLFL